MFRFVLKFIFIFIFSTSSWASAVNWSGQAKQDLSLIHQKIIQYQPYQFTNMKAPYAKWIDAGFNQAIKRVKNIKNYNDYRHVLTNYTKGFAIEHIYLTFNDDVVGQSRLKHTHKVDFSEKYPYVKLTNDNGVWIRLPSFQTFPNFDLAFSKELSSKLEKIANEMPGFRNKSYIVIDTRYNTGGSAQFSRPLIEKLYGKEYLRSLGESFIWNRQWQALYVLSQPKLMTLKRSDSLTDYRVQKKRYEQGGKFYLEKWYVIPYKRTNKKIKNPVTAKIILLTNGLCGSMCYEINRTWLQLPNVTLIGQSPNTMGLITNAVPFKISQYVSLVLASSIFTNMGDEFNKKLMPSYVYSGEMNNMKDMHIFVKTALKKISNT